MFVQSFLYRETIQKWLPIFAIQFSCIVIFYCHTSQKLGCLLVAKNLLKSFIKTFEMLESSKETFEKIKQTAASDAFKDVKCIENHR